MNCLNIRAGIASKRGSTAEALALYDEMEKITRDLGENLRVATCLMAQANLLSQNSATRAAALAKCREAQSIYELADRELDLHQAKLAEVRISSGLAALAGLRQSSKIAIGSLSCLLVIALGVGLGLWNAWLWLLGGPLVLLGIGNLLMTLFPRLMMRSYRLTERLSAEVHEEEVRRRQTS